MKGMLAGIGERARDRGLDIGFVSLGFAPDVGGIETHMGQLAQEFLARGHRVHVLCVDSRSARAPYTALDAVEAGVRVRRVAYRYHDHRDLADLSDRSAANDVLMAWLAEEPCDVVHVQHASGFGAGALQAISDMGRPLCVSLHDYWLLCPRGQMLRNDAVICERAEPALCGVCLAATWPHLMPSKRGESIAFDAQAASARLRHALAMLALPARLFAPSAAARDIFERAGVPAGKIQVLRNGVDVHGLAARVETLRASNAPRDGKLRLGVLGTAQPSKGVLEFARTALALDEPDLVVEVHGALPDYHGDPTYVSQLRELATREPRLVLCGEYAHADLARILARLDAVAVPSLWNEVFGLSAREARAAGLFVFASDRGGLSDLRGDPGVRLLPAGDARAWGSALSDFVREQRASGARRSFAPPANLRSVHELALELEQHYVELVRSQLGREPALAFVPGSDRQSQAPEAKSPGASAVQPWWRRVLGN